MKKYPITSFLLLFFLLDSYSKIKILKLTLADETNVPPLSGNWIRGDFVGLGESGDMDPGILTQEGRRRWDAYNFKVDDPSYKCIPASWTRVWLNPNVVVKISQTDDEVRLKYEFMDLDRVIPLGDPVNQSVERFNTKGIPTLGYSFAWYEADTLVIDTINISRGYISTIADWAGLPQSRFMHTVERISKSKDILNIEITHDDSIIFNQPFVTTISYVPTDYQLMKYNCDPEEASIVEPNS